MFGCKSDGNGNSKAPSANVEGHECGAAKGQTEEHEGGAAKGQTEEHEGGAAKGQPVPSTNEKWENGKEKRKKMIKRKRKSGRMKSGRRKIGRLKEFLYWQKKFEECGCTACVAERLEAEKYFDIATAISDGEN